MQQAYVRSVKGQFWGRPEGGRHCKHLLAGLARCGVCGAGITVVGGVKRVSNPSRRFYYYACHRRLYKGDHKCTNKHLVPIEKMDKQIIGSIEATLLTPSAVEYTIERSLKLMAEQARQQPDRTVSMEAELKKLKGELNNFLQAIAKGDAPNSVLEAIKVREERISWLEAELIGQKASQEIKTADLANVRRGLEQVMGHFRAVLRSGPTRARQALKKLLDGPLKFIPAYDDNGKKDFYLFGQAQALSLNT